MIQWIRTSRLSINYISQVYCGETHLVEKVLKDRTVATGRLPRSRPDGPHTSGRDWTVPILRPDGPNMTRAMTGVLRGDVPGGEAPSWPDGLDQTVAKVATGRIPYVRSRPDGRPEHFISYDAHHDRCTAGRRTLWRSSLSLSLSLYLSISLSLSPALALYLALAHALYLP